jgi:hypothetical protein
MECRKQTFRDIQLIRREFNISKYSTVSSVVLKVENELKKDKRLKKRTNDVQKLLVKGQRQTCPLASCMRGWIQTEHHWVTFLTT